LDIILLFKSIVGLAIILGILVLFLVVPKRLRAKKEKEKALHVETKATLGTSYDAFEKLKAVIVNKESTREELKEAVSLIVKYHLVIHKKLGILAHPDSDTYMDAIFKLCRHKNTDKNITISFINELEKRNPDYKKEINDAMMRGLNSRGI